MRTISEMFTASIFLFLFSSHTSSISRRFSLFALYFVFCR